MACRTCGRGHPGPAGACGMTQRDSQSDALAAKPASGTIRLTVAQALVRYLGALRTEAGEPLFGGIFAIFGHGNVAGIGEALYQNRETLPTYRAQNEQAMAHNAIAYAKAHIRKRKMAGKNSIGPRANNPVN